MSLRTKITIYLIAFISLVLAVTVSAISLQVRQQVDEQADLLAQTLTEKAYGTLHSYHALSRSILTSHVEKLSALKDSINAHSTIVPQLLRQQHESIVDFVQDLTASGEADFAIMFNNDGRLLAHSAGASGYKAGDSGLPDKLAAFADFPVLQQVNGILQKEVSLQISPSRAHDLEKKANLAGFVRLSSHLLPALLAAPEEKRSKGTIAIVACGIVRDEFSMPMGISLIGKFIHNLDEIFQDFTHASDMATTLYIDRTPVAFTGFAVDPDNLSMPSDLMFDEIDAASLDGRAQPVDTHVFFAGQRFFSTCSPIADMDGNPIGILCSSLPYAHLQDIKDPVLAQTKSLETNLQVWLVGLGSTMIFVTLFIAVFFARQLTKPIDQMVDLTVKVGRGDLSSRLNMPGGNELGVLAQSLDAMLDKLVHTMQERERLERQLELSKKMEAIGTLAGGVAHDLNNVLSGIVSYPDLLLTQIPQDSELRRPIQTIKRSGQKAAAIVQDLLNLARRGVPVTEVIDLNTVVREYLQSPEHEQLLSHHADVTVGMELDDQLLNCMGSRVHLSKAIMNLVSNAVEAMPQGGELSIATRNQRLSTTIPGYDEVIEGDYVVVAITDTGIGISAEERDKIFDPFFTRKTMGRSGTGLGMTVVWGTVQDHQGYIQVDSTPGAGTTFELFFPTTAKPASEPKGTIDMAPLKGAGESILVVDDIREQRMLATEILAALGYWVDSVASGAEAVAYVKERSVDLLVLDMIMEPGMDGLDTYRKILEIRPNQKAIIATGFSETDRVKMAMKIGVGAYLNKPYTLENIGYAVKQELAKKSRPTSFPGGNLPV